MTEKTFIMFGCEMKNIFNFFMLFITFMSQVVSSEDSMEMYKKLEEKFIKMPGHYTIEACDRFEKDVLDMECSQHRQYESFGRIDFDASTNKFSGKEVSLAKESRINPRMAFILSYLERIKFQATNDFCFFITLGDQGSLPVTIGDQLHKVPFLCLDRVPGNSGLQNALIVPDFYLISTNHQDTIRAIEKSVTAHESTPKRDVAGWRGSQTGGLFNIDAIGKIPRLNLVMYSKDHPGYVDARFVSYDCQLAGGEEGIKYKDFMTEKFGPPAPYVPFPEMVRYKYNVSLDGNVSAWARPAWVLFTKSALLFNTKFETFYTPFFKEYVHYIPIKTDMSDIADKIDELRRDPALYKRITENGFKFAQEFFSPASIGTYYETVLRKIASKFTKET